MNTPLGAAQLHAFCAAHDASPVLEAQDHDVGNILHYVHEHLFEEDLTVRAVLEACSVTSHSYCERFKQAIHRATSVRLTLRQYIETRRIEAAKLLLQHTTMDRLSIALSTGFGSPRRLERAFRRWDEKLRRDATDSCTPIDPPHRSEPVIRAKTLARHEGLHAFCMRIQDSFSSDAADLTVARLLRYIHNNLFEERLTVKYALRKCGIRSHTINANFKKEMIRRGFGGVSIHYYVEALRMDAARVLLADGEIPITAIGDALGYRSTEQFIRAAHRCLGCSPSSFRLRTMYARGRSPLSNGETDGRFRQARLHV